MSSFVTRAITATFFVVILLGGFYVNEWTAAALSLLIVLLGTIEFVSLGKKAGLKPTVFGSVGLVMTLSIIMLAFILGLTEFSSLAIIIPILLVIPIARLFSKSSTPLQDVAVTITPAVYIALPFICLMSLGITSYSTYYEYHFEPVFGFFFIMWANDTGAYITGMNLGKTKLFERISPKKTWEGTIGGVILGILMGVGNYYLLETYSLQDWIIIGLIVTTTGTIGDLIESMYKRQVGVKDSGKIMPGHGGILDRFDSTLIAAPAVFTYVQLTA